MEFNNYMGKFTTSGEVQTAISNGDLLNPYVALVGGEIDFNSLKGYKETPLTFEILSGGTICWKANNTAYTVTLEYSKNGGEWTEITSNTGTSAPTITVESGDTVQFRGNNATLATSGSRYNTFSGTTCTANLSGNIMSLLKKDNFSTADTLQSGYTFYSLFSDCRIKDASKLILPATTLANSCYANMFQKCRNLTTAPSLPATTLAESCYQSMFTICTSLTTAPALPATTLVKSCYYDMFNNCIRLIEAPALPATTLAERCYSGMFAYTNVLPDCSNIDFTSATVVASGGLKGLFSGTRVTDNDLRQILPINPNTNNYYLPTTTLADSCYQSMFAFCTKLTTAPELPATTLANQCYSNMFSNCTGLTTAPVLPATTLTNFCYNYMFAGCTSLATAPALPATTLTNSCYDGMFQNTNVLPDCSNIDFTSATVVASGGLRGLFRGTKVTDNDLRQILPINPSTNNYYLPVTTLADYCYNYMFTDCTSLTTAPELPATTLASQCYYAMFQGCTSLTTAPELPATILTTWCYSIMFQSCISLNYIKCLATDISANNCTSNWVRGITSTGTFVKNQTMTSWTEGTSGIPSGWTIQDNV